MEFLRAVGRFILTQLAILGFLLLAPAILLAAAGMPLDLFRDVTHLSAEQALALDDLALAVTKATQDIKIACPAEMALTAPGRMAAKLRSPAARARRSKAASGCPA